MAKNPNAKQTAKKKNAENMRKRAAAKREARGGSTSKPSGSRKAKGLAFKPKKIHQAPSAHLHHIVDKRLPGWPQAQAVLDQRNPLAKTGTDG